MTAANALLVRTLLLLWVICVVLCEHTKRDVHRIVIKERIPRSHKKSPQVRNHHGSGHKHGHSGRDHASGYKKGKKPRNSSEEVSLEDADSFSRENSLEDKPHSYTAYKSHHQPKKPKTKPSYPTNLDYDSARPEPYREDSKYHSDWVPLSLEQVYTSSSREKYRGKRKNRKESKHRESYITSLKPPPVEITTSYPFQLDGLPFYTLKSFPNTFSNWNYNQKIFQSNPPLIGTIEHPNMQIEDGASRLKNHRTSYEVTDLPEPEDTNIKTIISIPDDSQSVNSKEESNFRVSIKAKTTSTTTTSKPTRSRARGSYRGSRKN